MVSQAEYGAATTEIVTAESRVPLFLTRHGGFLYLGAIIPDSTYYWGDDLAINVDPDGSGGDALQLGDRQWLLRRLLDSSYAVTSPGGRWYPAGTQPANFGAERTFEDFAAASTSTATAWQVEIRIRERILQPGAAPARISFRTFNDIPIGWFMLPRPPEGMRPAVLERTPGLWLPLRIR